MYITVDWMERANRCKWNWKFCACQKSIDCERLAQIKVTFQPHARDINRQSKNWFSVSRKQRVHVKLVPNSFLFDIFFQNIQRIFTECWFSLEFPSILYVIVPCHIHVNNWIWIVHHTFTNTTSLPSFLHVHRIQMRKPNKATTLIPAKQLLSKISPQLTDDFTMFRLRLVQRIVRFFTVAPWFRANSTSTSQLTQKYALFFVEKTAWPLWPIRIDFSLFLVCHNS